jgi:hydroxybutyrate-dimer hydrolase
MEGQMSKMTRVAFTLVMSSVALTAATMAERAWADDDRVLHTHYDGITNDLLTAGLGALGLQGAAPAVADPLHPTIEELRRVAIYNNYRALVDISTKGGLFFMGPTSSPTVRPRIRRRTGG